jgi:hypothetical protein
MNGGVKFQSALFLCFFSLFLILGTANMQAQSKKLALGLNIGPIFSNQWSTEETPAGYEKPGGESGLSLGLYLNLRLSKRFSLQGEIGLVEKGANHNLLIEGFPFGPIDVTYSTEYIEVPIWLKFYVIKGKTLRLYTGGGGYIAFLLNGEYTVENEFIPTITEDLEDIKQSDLGFLFNWGLEIKAGDFLAHVEYRYSMGLTDIASPTGPGAPTIDLRHLGHYVCFGISFALL